MANKAPLAPEIAEAEVLFRDIMILLGLTEDEEALENTPRRFVKSLVSELCSGAYPENMPDLTTFDEVEGINKKGLLTTVHDISYTSLCRHHFLPVQGSASIELIYKTGSKILGLSKLTRLVRFFAAKPTLQEELTLEIGCTLSALPGLKLGKVVVTLKATHSCVAHRGVCDQEQFMVTTFER